MKKLLVFLIPFVLLVGCGDESTEKAPETEVLGNETVIDNTDEEAEQDDIEEDTNVVDEDKSNDLEEKEDTKKNDKPVAVEKPVVKEQAETKDKTESVSFSGTKEKYLNQLNGIESGLSDLNKQYQYGTQTEMHHAKSEIYTRWDEALNEIYGVLQKQLTANEMSSLKEEQRNWIKQRDQKSKDEAAIFEGGTMEATIYVSTQAQLTKERCYELVKNYMK